MRIIEHLASTAYVSSHQSPIIMTTLNSFYKYNALTVLSENLGTYNGLEGRNSKTNTIKEMSS